MPASSLEPYWIFSICIGDQYVVGERKRENSQNITGAQERYEGMWYELYQRQTKPREKVHFGFY